MISLPSVSVGGKSESRLLLMTGDLVGMDESDWELPPVLP